MLLIEGQPESMNDKSGSHDLRQEVVLCEAQAVELKAEISRLKSTLRLTHQRIRRLNLRIQKEKQGQPSLRLVRVS